MKQMFGFNLIFHLILKFVLYTCTTCGMLIMKINIVVLKLIQHTVEKKNDLISFRNSLVIPPIYWHFYNSLTTNTTVKDRLPLSDHLKDDQDSE
jgi:hypothetical protein